MPNNDKKSVRKAGPKTTLGKLRASRNSRKHGIFARKFDLGPDEKMESNELRHGLQAGLKPTSPLLEILFEDVLDCSWRMKIALRAEQLEVRKQLAEPSELEKAVGKDELPMAFPYRVTAFEIHRRLRFADYLLSVLPKHFHLDSQLKEPVSDAFGPEFWKMLEEFTPTDPILMQMMDHAAKLHANFDTRILGPEATPEQEAKHRQTDSSAILQMRTKLVEQVKLLLQQLLHYVEQTENGKLGTTTSSDRLDLYLRYSTTARRDFNRSLHLYLEIKEKGL
jgi:hypothetical protein